LQVAPVVNKQIAAHAVIATRQRGTDDEETQGRPNAYAAAEYSDDDLAQIFADEDAANAADRERAAAADPKPPGRTRGQRGGNRGKNKR
jgi:hypothetical protein